jgi:hypothetical protein
MESRAETDGAGAGRTRPTICPTAGYDLVIPAG